MFLSRFIPSVFLGVFWAAVCLGSVPTRSSESDDPDFIGCAQELVWRQQNNSWYAELGFETFQSIVEKKGLGNHADYRRKEIGRLLGIGGGVIPHSVLVIGAGFGRDLDFLTRETDVSVIHAVEVGQAQLKVLRLFYNFDSDFQQRRARLGQPKQEVHIYEANIQDFQLTEKVQVAFWMFNGIVELSPDEKRIAIERIHSQIDDGGTLVVDIPAGTTEVNFSLVEGGADVLQLKNPRGNSLLNVHPWDYRNNQVDEKKLVHFLTKKDRFLVESRVDYRTDTGDKRRLLLFFKVPANR